MNTRPVQIRITNAVAACHIAIRHFARGLQLDLLGLAGLIRRHRVCVKRLDVVHASLSGAPLAPSR
jgi:hypothetical protein